MLSYLFEAGVCWTLFYLLYYFTLRRETFFQLNRCYLLATLFLGLIIPLLNISFLPAATEATSMAYYLEPITVSVHSLEYTLETIVVNAEREAGFNWPQLIWIIYCLGLLLALFRILLGFYKIYQLHRSAEVEVHAHYHLVKTRKPHSPFSFFNLLFWSNDIQLTMEERHHIIRHELAHIRQGHSIDVVLTELLTAVFWCLPPLYFFKSALREVHEYLADAAVYQATPKKEYGRLLLKQAQSGLQPALAHSFFHSQLKQRIIMMTRNKSNRKALVKYFGLLPIAAVLLLAFSPAKNSFTNTGLAVSTMISNADPFDKTKVEGLLHAGLTKIVEAKGYGNRIAAFRIFEKDYQDLCMTYKENKSEIVDLIETLIAKTKAPIIIKDGSDNPSLYFAEAEALEDGRPVFAFVDEMPRFPGCAGKEGETLKECATKEMLVFIYSNIKYPVEAKEQGIEGTVVARFVIDENGKIVAPKVVRAIGGGCEAEVLRVINSMPNWIPGTKGGKNVSVQFNLPIKFKLDGGDQKLSDKEEIHQKVENMPLFPGCERTGTIEEQKTCSNTNLINFLVKHLKYPQEAKEGGVEGVVAIRFIVDKAGNPIEPELIKSIGFGCDQEVKRVFDLMVKDAGVWTPGMLEDGKKVSVYYTLPVAFRLEAKDRNAIKEPVASLTLSNFKAFPNPVKDVLNLSFQSEAGPLSITLVDASGREQGTMAIQDFDGNFDGNITLKNPTSGTLILTIRQGERLFVQKLIVQ